MAMGSYDSALQMFVQKPKDPTREKLEEIRWRVENGRLGARPILGRPRGDYAKVFGYEGADGQPLRVNVISQPTPEGARLKMDGSGRERQ